MTGAELVGAGAGVAAGAVGAGGVTVVVDVFLSLQPKDIAAAETASTKTSALRDTLWFLGIVVLLYFSVRLYPVNAELSRKTQAAI